MRIYPARHVNPIHCGLKVYHMQRLKILIWHIHGSYLNTLARIDADWYLPVKAGRPEGYGGRGPTFDLPTYVREVPAEQVRDLKLDLIIYQTPKNYFEDQFEILSAEQRQLPKIYLEHNTPRPLCINETRGVSSRHKGGIDETWRKEAWEASSHAFQVPGA